MSVKAAARFSLPLCCLLVLLPSIVACVQGNTNQTATGNKLVVYIVGFNETLSTGDAAKNNGYGYAGTLYGNGSIQPYLQETREFRNAQSLVFSYEQYAGDGKPNPFPCSDTYTLSLAEDVNILQLQIDAYLQSHANTQVYLVGHSLGGVIAFAYMASIVENRHTTSLLNGGVLKGIAILDSPLNGLAYSPGYEWAIIALGDTCQGVKDYTITSQLQTLGGTGSGDQVSILGTLLNGSFISNQKAAEDAAMLGVALLIVGNRNDFLWQPDICNLGQNFLGTQYLREEGKVGRGALYVRSFVGSTALFCNVLLIKKSHFEVLNNGDVQKDIWETFTGRDVDQLQPVATTPAALTPTPTAISIPTPTPTLIPTPTDMSPPSLFTPGATWQVQATYYSGQDPWQGTLTLDTVQAGSFTGSLSEPQYDNSIVSVSGFEGDFGQFSSDDQNNLQYAIQLYGNPTGIIVAFTDPDSIQGGGIQLGCSYDLVLYSDGIMQGVWFYPGDSQPDGTLLFTPT